MKTITFITLFTLLLSFSLKSQSTDETTKYRVTAYKKGNTQVYSVSNEVTTTPDIHLYIPNAFTPNNDGLNDLFGAVGEGLEEYHLTIYNRWGAKIFESTDINTKWDGTYKGEAVELGTYTYSLAAKGGLQKKNIYKSGAVTVVL
jgi:gliding motility-associated-like protein